MAKADTKNKKVKNNLIDDEPEIAVVHTELDPEVLEAIGTKRPKKSKLNEVDYVPELERDESDMDFGSNED